MNKPLPTQGEIAELVKELDLSADVYETAAHRLRDPSLEGIRGMLMHASYRNGRAVAALEALAAERGNRKGICLTGPDGDAYIAPFDVGAEARAQSWKGVATYLRDVLVKNSDNPLRPSIKAVLATYEAQLAADPDDDLPAPPASKEGRGDE